MPPIECAHGPNCPADHCRSCHSLSGNHHLHIGRRKARQIGRLAATAARVEEHAQIAADRLEDRSDDAFVRALVALATLNTINLRAESAAEPLRELRVGLTLLEAASISLDSELLAGWFETERNAGLAQAKESMRRLGLTPAKPTNEAEVEAIVAAGAPLNLWARDFAGNLRLWRRNGATGPELLGLIERAKSLF